MRIAFLLLFPLLSFAQVRPESFIIKIKDRSMEVVSPDKKKSLFSVLIENKSLSDQVGKFTGGGKTLKFITIKSGKSESIEIENKSNSSVVFIPLSPSFQEVPLNFGKRAYEIPAKD